MSAPPVVVDGVELLIDGDGDETLLMLHGWPDDATLWQGLVGALSDRFRCVRFTLPGFGPGSRGPVSLPAMTATLARIADAVSPDRPVTLVLHDWGCVFGYHFLALHPQRVARVVGLDIGDAGSRAHRRELSWVAIAGLVAYQGWLALAWWLGGHGGGRLGDGMARAFSTRYRCPTPPERVHAGLGWPYWMVFTGAAGGLLRARRVDEPPCPLFYAWGRRKPFMFHSQAWVERLRAQAGCVALEMDAGHWLMADRPAELAGAVRAWLAAPQDVWTNDIQSWIDK
jgi:cis-3-alkyl-4-acyloxetan-2-one decarboxylase